jgi:hypothetical protein
MRVSAIRLGCSRVSAARALRLNTRANGAPRSPRCHATAPKATMTRLFSLMPTVIKTPMSPMMQCEPGCEQGRGYGHQGELCDREPNAVKLIVLHDQEAHGGPARKAAVTGGTGSGRTRRHSPTLPGPTPVRVSAFRDSRHNRAFRRLMIDVTLSK